MNRIQPVSAWDAVVALPETKRFPKPRTEGITMVIDKGLGLTETRELLEMAADHMDFLKIAFGSSALYPTRLMKEKLALVKSYGVHVYPGGTLFEIAFYQGMLKEFLPRLGTGFKQKSRRHHRHPGTAAGYQDGVVRLWVVSESGRRTSR